MNKIGSLIERQQQTAQDGKQSTTSKSLPASWVSALFAKFRGRYGHQWISRFGTAKDYQVAQREWAEILGNMNGEDIKRGLTTWREKWPPNVFEFLDACKPPRQTAAHQLYQALPAPECHVDVQAQLRNLRIALRRRQVNRWQQVHGMIPLV